MAVFVLATISALATTQKDFFQNANLNDGNNYNPSGLPSFGTDLLLTTAATALTLNGTSLDISSLNQTNNAAYLISNGSISLRPLGGNVIGANNNDAIYLGGNNSSLTIQVPLGLAGSNLDVAQAGSTLNISGSINVDASNMMTKIGSGTLNLSGSYSAFGGGMAINGGTTNFLAGFSNLTPTRTGLAVNNLNTGPGDAVTLNVQTSAQFRGLGGVVAAPSSGVNAAIVNVVGPATELSLIFTGAGPTSATYAGKIAGDGRVSFTAAQSSFSQTFSGNNTYTGTTTVGGGTLRINGTTSGQGNYIVNSDGFVATLTGSGTIGLATNGTVTVGGGNPSRLSAGADSGAGTLNVVTSGTGGVIFGSASIFLADIGPAGASDLLAIAGGYIDLTSSTDTLNLNSLAGGFDGSSYTIATFNQNLGSGVFNTVTGLPANYVVAYLPTAIMIVPVPEPTIWALAVQGTILLCWGARRLSNRNA